VPETDGYQVPTESVPVTALVGQTLLLTPFALTALPPVTAQEPPGDDTSVVTSG
jgi:hypothetical protein